MWAAQKRKMVIDCSSQKGRLCVTECFCKTRSGFKRLEEEGDLIGFLQ